jgi:hypothetical protein
MGYLDVVQWVPSVIALSLWIRARLVAAFSPHVTAALAGWYLAALALQLLSWSIATTVTGFLLQVALAVFLACELRTTQA